MNKLTPRLISEYQQSLTLHQYGQPYSQFIKERNVRNACAAELLCQFLLANQLFTKALCFYEVASEAEGSICQFLPAHFHRVVLSIDPKEHCDFGDFPLLQDGCFILSSYYTPAVEAFVSQSFTLNHAVNYFGFALGIVGDPYYQSQCEQNKQLLSSFTEKYPHFCHSLITTSNLCVEQEKAFQSTQFMLWFENHTLSQQDSVQYVYKQ